MCFGKREAPTTPAPAPAPPAPSPDEPEIGSARKAESRKAFGGMDAPNYRSNRSDNPTISQSGQIRM